MSNFSALVVHGFFSYIVLDSLCREFLAKTLAPRKPGVEEFKFIRDNVRDVPSVVLGPGDDCSAVAYDQEYHLIASTDCLVEGVHFRLNDFTMAELAYKSVAVNISDISAMGGVPKWMHLSLAVPKSFQESKVSEFFYGVNQVCQQHELSLLGGDLSASKSDLFINIHISGLVPKKSMQKRSDFLCDDFLCVTGPLGDSSAGLYCLINQVNQPEFVSLIQSHKKPPIENKQAQWLASQRAVRGMIDLSDGLLSDIKQMREVGFKVEIDKIPTSKELRVFCHQLDLNIHNFTLGGGEDYRILFGCKQQEWLQIKKQYKEIFNQNVYCLGEIQPKESGVIWLEDGRPIDIQAQSFSHF